LPSIATSLTPTPRARYCWFTYAGALIRRISVLLLAGITRPCWWRKESLAISSRFIRASAEIAGEFFSRRKSVGRLVTRLTTDVDAINEALRLHVDHLHGCAHLVGHRRHYVDAELAVGAGHLSAPAPLLVALNFFRVRSREVYRVIRERIARINAFLQETLSGITVVQLFAQEKKLFAEFERRNANTVMQPSV